MTIETKQQLPGIAECRVTCRNVFGFAGAKTSYLSLTAMNLGQAVEMDTSNLPVCSLYTPLTQQCIRLWCPNVKSLQWFKHPQHRHCYSTTLDLRLQWRWLKIILMHGDALTHFIHSAYYLLRACLWESQKHTCDFSLADLKLSTWYAFSLTVLL